MSPLGSPKSLTIPAMLGDMAVKDEICLDFFRQPENFEATESRSQPGSVVLATHCADLFPTQDALSSEIHQPKVQRRT
jgi:hypothetical protein